MTVTLNPLNVDNWEECAELKVGPTQEGMVAPNVWSIAEACVRPESEIFAICHNGEMVGFLMSLEHEGTETVELYRFMIAFEHQQSGYGLTAVQQFIEYQRAKENSPKKLVVKFLIENFSGKKLYEKAGFQDTGELEENKEWRFTEHVYSMDLV